MIQYLGLEKRLIARQKSHHTAIITTPELVSSDPETHSMPDKGILPYLRMIGKRGGIFLVLVLK